MNVNAQYAKLDTLLTLLPFDDKRERVRGERIGFVEGVKLGMFALLGQGIVDMQTIFTALERAGDNGRLIVEQDASEDPPPTATRNRAYSRASFGV